MVPPASSVIAGAGFGLAVLGNIRAVNRVAAPAQRAGVLAVLYIVPYTMFSIPIAIVGFAETHLSGHDVALVFSGCVTALAGIGTVASLTRPRPSASPTSPSTRSAADPRPRHAGRRGARRDR